METVAGGSFFFLIRHDQTTSCSLLLLIQPVDLRPSPCSALQLMSAVKKGQVSGSRLAILMKTAEETLEKRGPVTVDRSGGGV